MGGALPSCCEYGRALANTSDEPLPRQVLQRICIVRHGPRFDHLDPEGWCASPEAVGHLYDSPLAPGGFEMAEAIGENIPRVFDLIVASPYLRCVQTAAEIAKVHRLPILFDTELGEIFDDFYMPTSGGAEQVRSTEWLTAYMKKSYGDVKVIAADGSSGSEVNIFGRHPTFPENFDMAKIRFMARIEDICRSAKGASVLFVFHADGVVALMQVLGAVQVEKCSYCGWFFAERQVDPDVESYPYTGPWRCQVGDHIESSTEDVPTTEDERVKLVREIKKLSKAYRKITKAEPVWPFPSWISARAESAKPIEGFWKNAQGVVDNEILVPNQPGQPEQEEEDPTTAPTPEKGDGERFWQVARAIGGSERRSCVPVFKRAVREVIKLQKEGRLTGDLSP